MSGFFQTEGSAIFSSLTPGTQLLTAGTSWARLWRGCDAAFHGIAAERPCTSSPMRGALQELQEAQDPKTLGTVTTLLLLTWPQCGLGVQVRLPLSSSCPNSVNLQMTEPKVHMCAPRLPSWCSMLGQGLHQLEGELVSGKQVGQQREQEGRS